MGRFIALVFVVLTGACVEPKFTKCPEVDCPASMVCDGQGGCATAEQLSLCAGQDNGFLCEYTGVDKGRVMGACANNICLPIGCGNNFVTSPEVCDDGNTQNGDGCSADCLSSEVCGNGIVDPAVGEQCDDLNNVDGDGCQANCKNPRCGDGITDSSLNEGCDQGTANSLAPDAACRPNCQVPRCGDGVVDPSINEICDDGNNNPNDGCAGDCKSDETCGNGVIDVLAGEVCDDNNTNSNDGCRDDCKSTEACGNNVMDTARGEVCDDGNIVSGDGCSSDCRSKEICGNGVLDTIFEECDLGMMMNSDAPDSACRVMCKLPKCGDMIIDTLHGEQCDNGASNANTGNACRLNCQLPRCGDNIVNTGEVCDDGNQASNDGCSGDCKSNEMCGNGIVDTVKGEECDSSGVNTATCVGSTCKLSSCGDGYINSAAMEQCDSSGVDTMTCVGSTCKTSSCGDGHRNTAAMEQCDSGGVDIATCVGSTCKTSTCGDGHTNAAAGEQCDSMGTNTATCVASTCKTSSCGDGYTNSAAMEQCDSSGTNTATCVAATCKTSSCGDGVTNTAAMEQCDSSGVNTATCVGATCKTSSCGDNVVNMAAGEQCDTGNAVNTATCVASTCKTSTCGDGYRNTAANEQCDSSGFDSPTCIGATCRTSTCGDGYVNFAAAEQCDSSSVNTATCVGATCKTSRCGDGVTNAAASEQCDTSGADTVACVGITCRTSTCGDGYRNTVALEQCDSGGGDTSTCVGGTCRTSSCGDSYTNIAAGEQCDSGGSNTAACVGGTCRTSRCGDSYTNTAALEQCDTGGPDTAACIGATCRNSVCGDGYLNTQANEACDDSNTRGRDGCSACKAEDAVVLEPGDTPPARRDTAMVYDAGRQRVVMFGGFNGSSMSDTWEWDGVSWTRLLPLASPNARSQHGMAYDVFRKRVVLFGGVGQSGNLGDTWEWDGNNWKQIIPNTGNPPIVTPAARTLTAMAYDAHRKKVVMYGGFTTAALADFVEWTGTQWQTITTATSPGLRSGHQLAYDASRNILVMYGGNQDSATWVYNGTDWSRPSAASGIDLAQHMALAYDSTRAAVVVWHKNDVTWEFNGTSWATVTTAGTTPSARDGSAMAYDAVRKQLVHFGGFTVSGMPAVTSYYQDTMLRTNTAWTPAPAWVAPTARVRTASVFDPARGVTVLFGGQEYAWAYNDVGYVNDTWEFDGRKWTNKSPTTPANLTPRGNHLMDYNLNTRQVMLFSGDNYNNNFGRQFFSDLYTYNGSTNAWSALGGTRNDYVRLTSMTYDPVNQRCITFGTAFQNNDMYQWTSAGGGTWSSVTQTNRPLGRHNTAMAFDRSRNKVMMFGGYVNQWQGNNDLWEMDPSTNTWTQIFSFPVPAQRKAHALLYNPDAAATVVYGNNNTESTEDLWEYRSTGWTKRTIFNPPPVRYHGATAYDSARHFLLSFGGRDFSTCCNYVQDYTQIIRYRTNVTPESCMDSKIDYDGDGLMGCADDECWGVCDPLKPPGLARPAGAPFCGDGSCNAAIENNWICPGDCTVATPQCGDLHCEAAEVSGPGQCLLDCP